MTSIPAVVKLWEEGQTAFDSGDYKLAISKWEQAQEHVFQIGIRNLIGAAKIELEMQKQENKK